MEHQQVTQKIHQKVTQTPVKVMLTRPPVHPLLQLQQAMGNQAFGRFIQTQLKINQPEDMYEQEADQVAEQVMRMPESMPPSPSNDSHSEIQRKYAECASGQSLCSKYDEEEKMAQRKPLASQITPLIHRQEMEEPEEEEEEETPFQAKRVSGNAPKVTPDIEANINSLKGNGQPLPASVRAFFEPRFGYDFSQIRIHTGVQAAELARAVNARAFTVGQDVVFGSGQYAPNTAERRRIVAHELTHVVQQGKSQPIAVPSSIHSPTISSWLGNPPMVARQVDVEETIFDLEEENKDPQDLEETEAADIGEEALRTVGYEEIISLALEAGLLERKETSPGETMVQRQLQPPQDTIFRQAGATTFGAVFGRWAVAAGIASQVDSPAPGPGDVVAIGILAVGLVAAGITVLMAKGGEQNVADTGIMEEVHRLIEAAIAAGTALTICEALAQLLRAAQAARDTERIRRIQTTQKAKGCRHRGGG